MSHVCAAPLQLARYGCSSGVPKSLGLLTFCLLQITGDNSTFTVTQSTFNLIRSEFQRAATIGAAILQRIRVTLPASQQVSGTTVGSIPDKEAMIGPENEWKELFQERLDVLPVASTPDAYLRYTKAARSFERSLEGDLLDSGKEHFTGSRRKTGYSLSSLSLDASSMSATDWSQDNHGEETSTVPGSKRNQNEADAHSLPRERSSSMGSRKSNGGTGGGGGGGEKAGSWAVDPTPQAGEGTEDANNKFETKSEGGPSPTKPGRSFTSKSTRSVGGEYAPPLHDIHPGSLRSHGREPLPNFRNFPPTHPVRGHESRSQTDFGSVGGSVSLDAGTTRSVVDVRGDEDTVYLLLHLRVNPTSTFHGDRASVVSLFDRWFQRVESQVLRFAREVERGLVAMKKM